MRVRATLIELWKRVIKSTTSDTKIYYNGSNNLYPNEIERVINNSPTAKRCAIIMSKYIAGDGLIDETKNIIINDKKGYKTTDIISKIASNIAYQYGAFIHVNYGINEEGDFVVKNPDVLDYLKCRLSKEDADENLGKIYYKDYENKSTITSNNDANNKWFYPYNKDKNIILAQIKNDFDLSQKDNKIKEEFTLEKGLNVYRGQVYYLNLSPYIYALSPVDSAYNDADSEYRISLYTNTQTREGFMGKTIFMVQGLDEEKVEEIGGKLSGLLGTENSASALLIEFDQVQNIDEVVRIEQIKPQFDDKLFLENVSRIRKNILGSFNNIPEPLVFAGEGSLFGVNDQTYSQMKKFFSEQTAFERRKVEETLNMLGFEVEIKEIGYNGV